MTIIDLIGQLPVHPVKAYPMRVASQITRLVLHHAAGPEDQTPTQIAQFHVQTREWPGIGYSYLVDPLGAVYKCWATSTVTSCVKGGNTPSLCVCLIGNRSVVPMPNAQWNAAVDLFRDLLIALPNRAIYGHRETPTLPPQATECPGKLIGMDAFREAVAEARGAV